MLYYYFLYEYLISQTGHAASLIMRSIVGCYGIAVICRLFFFSFPEIIFVWTIKRLRYRMLSQYLFQFFDELVSAFN